MPAKDTIWLSYISMITEFYHVISMQARKSVDFGREVIHYAMQEIQDDLRAKQLNIKA